MFIHFGDPFRHMFYNLCLTCSENIFRHDISVTHQVKRHVSTMAKITVHHHFRCLHPRACHLCGKQSCTPCVCQDKDCTSPSWSVSSSEISVEVPEDDPETSLRNVRRHNACLPQRRMRFPITAAVCIHEHVISKNAEYPHHQDKAN